MSDLKIGVIGSGGRGKYLGGLAHMPGSDARIVACCDVIPDVLKNNRRAYGKDIFVTDDYRKLLECELDAVIIGSPDYLHEEQAVATLERGLALYLEKPMAITISGCDRILRAAQKTGARLYVGHNMRHLPIVRKMRELVEHGAIGEVKACWVRHFVGNGGDFYFRDWHADRRYTHGLLLQKAVHDLDVIHWICGGFTREVSAMGALTVYGNIKDRLSPISGPRHMEGPALRPEMWPAKKQRDLNHRIDVEDLSQVIMRLDNGVLAEYSQCHYTPDYWRNFTVIGTEGRMENFGDLGSATLRLWTRRRTGYWPRGDANFTFSAKGYGHGGSDRAIMDEFLRFVRKGGTTETSPLAARESVATGYTATESLRAGGKLMKVPPFRPKAAASKKR